MAVKMATMAAMVTTGVAFMQAPTSLPRRLSTSASSSSFVSSPAPRSSLLSTSRLSKGSKEKTCVSGLGGLAMMADGKAKKIIVLGGDGFCGWPTSLHLSSQGHDVVVVDNLSRRNIDIEMGCDSLTPIQHPEIRLKAWEEVGGRAMRFVNLDVAKEYDLLVQLFKQEKPDAVVHFAEQRAAPYSMKTSKTKRYTVDNNKGERVEIFNQVAETARVRDLAKMIQDQTGCEVNYLNNPRNEDAENELVVSNNKFINFLGDMIRLESQEGLFDEVQTITSTYKHRCIKEKILPASFWNKRTAAACADNTLEVMKANVPEGEKKLGGVFM
ncbi:hypothetical protein GUITHDRAFT_121746 [Guillardia theta CCMP2712]|uniref:NAD-dependent epimerase/dehydratase domain-containing protein n=1 Tax=Guillardia theta (strain CCMP2712) TaxID=905079 RepID=L1I739_GUITC|nr:hypothetical protein GUITHDRAFT_121746 [Guillardia theta CCMP2712]EKX32073.1 hypothetical protein GUITHDRAFT_121746 [Guillardia theta CCMP2712]|eukprot:XP_005819053.1 hypothetical protein GUITHDRAFT_121746 [Guillardia theta CCMP2712]